jgi:hypothetical protein
MTADVADSCTVFCVQLFELLRVVEDIRLAPEVLEPDPVDIAGKFRNKYIKDEGTLCNNDYIVQGI